MQPTRNKRGRPPGVGNKERPARRAATLAVAQKLKAGAPAGATGKQIETALLDADSKVAAALGEGMPGRKINHMLKGNVAMTWAELRLVTQAGQKAGLLSLDENAEDDEFLSDLQRPRHFAAAQDARAGVAQKLRHLSLTAIDLAQELERHAGRVRLDQSALDEIRSGHLSGCPDELFYETMLSMPELLNFDANALVYQLSLLSVAVVAHRTPPPSGPAKKQTTATAPLPTLSDDVDIEEFFRRLQAPLFQPALVGKRWHKSGTVSRQN